MNSCAGPLLKSLHQCFQTHCQLSSTNSPWLILCHTQREDFHCGIVDTDRKRMESSYLASLSLGEESSQMWSLNKRLEAYLSRVKALEEENELLRAEIHQLQSSKSESCWKNKFFNEMRKLREVLDESHAEMVRVEADRDNIYEEIEFIKERCLQERHAQEDAKKELSESKKLLEEENRAQIWLKERLLQLEGELEEIIKAHEEDKELMEEEISSISQRLQNFKVAPVVIQPVNVDDYANKLSEIWREAVEGYKSEVSVLETSLSESRENLRKVLEENKQSKIHLQNLEKEMQSLKTRKDLLEQILSTQLQEQKEEEGNLQCEIEDLENEKLHLRTQIAQVLEDRQQLMHLKMSLSLEVATYRSLLEAESTRIYSPGMDYKLSSAFSDSILEPKNARRRQNRDNKKVLSTEYNLSSSKKQRAEKNQASRTSAHHLLNVKNTSYEKRTSPVTKEFQKVSSVLQSQSNTKAPIAKAVSSLPALESSFERRSQSADVFRKTNSKTVSPSYSLDSSKDKGLQEEKKDTKDLAVLKEHIYSTEERDSRKKEAQDKVNIKSRSTSSQEAPTSQLKEDNLDVTLKNIVEINKSITREYGQKVQEKKEEEQEIQLSETHQEEKKNLNVPKHDTSEDIVLNIAYQDGSYKSTEAIQASEEHETTRETISYQSIDFSLQDVIESNFSEEKEVDEGKVAESLDLHKLNKEADLKLSPEISEFDQKHEIPTFQITAFEKKESQLLSMDNDNVSEIIRKTVGGLLGSNLKIMSVTEVEHVRYQEDDSQRSQSFDQHIADQLSLEDVNVQPNREGQETVDLDNAENKTIQLPHEEQESRLSYEEKWTSKNLEEPVQQMQVSTVLKQYAAELHEIKEDNLQQDQKVEKSLSLNAMAEESKLSYDGKTTENITDIEEPVQQSEMFTVLMQATEECLKLEQASLQQFHEATSLELENAENDDQQCSTFIGTEENVEQIIASAQVNQQFNSRLESENQHFDKLTEDEDSSLKENIIEEKDFGFTSAGLHSIKLTYEHEGQLSDIEQKSDTTSDDKILNGVDDSIQMLDNKISLEQSVDVEQETTQPLVIEDDSLQHSLLKEPSAKEVLTQQVIEEGADLTASSEVHIDDQRIELKDYAHHVEENLQQTSDNEELCQSSDHEEHTAILEHQEVVSDHDATESFSDIKRNDAETFNLDIGLSNDTIKIEVDIVNKVQESQYEIFEHEHTKDEKEEHAFSENENDIAERQQECFLTETNLETNVSFTTKEVLNTQFELSANLQCDASEEENENKSPDHWVNEVVTVAKEDFHYVNQSPVEPKSEEVYTEEIEEIKERERGLNVNEEVTNTVENKDIEITYTEENVEREDKTEEYDRENVEIEEHVHKNVEASNTDENNEDVTNTEETIEESKESTKPQEIKENAEIKTFESREEIKTVEIIEPKENVVYEEATTVTKQNYEHEDAIQLEEYVEENVKAFNAEGKDCEEVRRAEETIEENEEHSKLEEHIKEDEFTETVENEDNVKTGELTETEENIEHKELRTTEEHVEENVEAINTEENLKGNEDIIKAGEIIEESEENIKTEEIIKENEEITIKEEIIKEYKEVTKAEENIVENEEDSKPEVNIKEAKVTETVRNGDNVKTGAVTQTKENIEENKEDSNTEDNIQEDEVTETVKNEDDVKTGEVTETEENIECKEITTTDGHVEENVETINTEDSEDVIIAGENIEKSEEDIKTEEIIQENEEIMTKEDTIKEYEEVTKAEENIVENEEDSKPEENIKEDKVTETVGNEVNVKTGEVTETVQNIECKELTTTDKHVEENLKSINTEENIKCNEDVIKAGENIEEIEDLKTEEIIKENEELTTEEEIIKECEEVTKAEENIEENEDSKPKENIKEDELTETVDNADDAKTEEVTETEENIECKEPSTADKHVEEILGTINTEKIIKRNEDLIKAVENIEASEKDRKTEDIFKENEKLPTEENIKEHEEVTKAEGNSVENKEDTTYENVKENKDATTIEETIKLIEVVPKTNEDIYKYEDVIKENKEVTTEDNSELEEETKTHEHTKESDVTAAEEHIEENEFLTKTEYNIEETEGVIKAEENEGFTQTSEEIIKGGDKINKELTNVENVEDLRVSENENIEISNITEPHNETKTIASPDEKEENIHNLERFVQHEKSETSEESDSPSLLQAENYSEYENAEYTVKISEIPNIEDAPKGENDFVDLEEQTNAVELSSEIPTDDSHVHHVEHENENDIAKSEVQSFIDEQQDASQNIITKTDNQDSEVEQSVDSQEDFSLLSQRSEEFEISSDYHQEKTLPDTTPLPNMDNEFEDLPKEQVTLPLESTDISEENQSIEESDKHDSLADEFAEVAVEKPDENKAAEVEESVDSQDDVSLLSQRDEEFEISSDVNQGKTLPDTTPLPNMNNTFEDLPKEQVVLPLESTDISEENQSKEESDKYNFLADEFAGVVVEKPEEDEPSELEESVDSQQDVLLLSQRSEEFEISSDDHQEKTLSDTTPLPNMDNEFEDIPKEQVVLPLESTDISEENQSIEESDKHYLLADKFADVAVEKPEENEPSEIICRAEECNEVNSVSVLDVDTEKIKVTTMETLSQGTSYLEENEFSDSLVKNVISQDVLSEDHTDAAFTQGFVFQIENNETIVEKEVIETNVTTGFDEYTQEHEKYVTDEEREELKVFKDDHATETVMQVANATLQKNQESISVDFQSVSSKSEELVNIVFQGNQQFEINQYQDRVSDSEDAGSSDDGSPNATINLTSKHEDIRKVITTEVYAEVEVTEEFTVTSKELGHIVFNKEETKETPAEPISACDDIVQIECNLSDQEKEVTSESSDSSCDLSNASESSELKSQSVDKFDHSALEFTKLNSANIDAVNGQQANEKFGWSDDMLNGHSEREDKEHEQSCKKGYIQLDTNAPFMHAYDQEFLGDPVIKFAMSEGKDEGLFQTLLETSELKDLSGTEEVASDSQTTKESSVYLDSANENEYTKLVQNPYLIDKDFHDQPQVISTKLPLTEEALIDSTNVQGSETYAGVSNVKHEDEISWSSDD
ncbi:nestin [Pelobates cultripes]|uniref:Nestin n=1 Tax=Pelobates cultripes TaxID=61616 RepID=A0AAD1WWR5_PELCU|nr:nestin [Pelobates cultripes]